MIDSAEQPWWKGYYTEGTTFDFERALAGPDAEAYRLLLRDIDAIAPQLQRLEDANVPVLWRLLHDRLTNVHGLDNLIWVWNSEAPDWYPGDDAVHIVSVASYPQPGDYSPVNERYERLLALVNDRADGERADSRSRAAAGVRYALELVLHVERRLYS